MKKLKILNAVSAVFWLAQVFAEGLLFYRIYRINMLLSRDLMIAGAVLILLLVFTGLLFFVRGRRSEERPGYARRVIAAVIALAAAAGCFAGSFAVSKLHQTVNKITVPTEITSTAAVYVMDSDPAKTIQDAAEYTFGITDSYGGEDIGQAVERIGKELGREITVIRFDSVPAMVDAFYRGEIRAMILNEAFAGLLEEIETYADFSAKARVIYRVSIVTEQETIPAETAAEESGSQQGAEGEQETEKLPITERPFIVYVSGSDTRSQVLTTSRSDVNILVVVNPVTRQVLLVNTPRDYYIPNPAGNGALDKLTHCGIYGIRCSMDALAGLYGRSIDYYAQINFTGFETLIDAIGGVNVYSEAEFPILGGKKVIHEGYNELNGEEALSFARERHALPGGDNDRGKNQMRVITAVINKMASGATIFTRYSAILDSLQGMFVTNVTSDELSELVKMQLSDLSGWNVLSYAVTGRGGDNTTYSMPGFSTYVMYPNEDTVAYASELIGRVMAGETLSAGDVAGKK